MFMNKFEFHFLRLHIDKTNIFYFLINNGHVTGTTKYLKLQFKALP